MQPAAYTDVRERSRAAAVAAFDWNNPAAVAAWLDQLIGREPEQDPNVDPQVPDGINWHMPKDVALDRAFVILGPKYVGEDWTPCPDEVRTVPFAFSCGNWGTLEKSSPRYTDMIDDLNGSPGHVWGVQEVNWDVCQDLINANPSDRVRDSSPRHEHHRWLIMRGYESGPTVAVAARNVMFKALRMDMFQLHFAGTEKGTQNIKYNRILCCTLKCRWAYFNDGENRDEIGVVVAHMDNLCATKETNEGATHHNDFWNTLAGAIHKYNGRFLSIDANMALWLVVPELRSRGIQISMVANYLFRINTMPHYDSLGIFAVGPVKSIRMAYSPAVALDIFEAGREVSGFPIHSYMPLYDHSQRKRFIKWSYTHVRTIFDDEFTKNVAELENRQGPGLEPFIQDRLWSQGSETWEWPQLPDIHQKPLQLTKMNGGDFHGRGCHMTLCMYCEGKHKQRTDHGKAKRYHKAKQRFFKKVRERRKAQQNHGTGKPNPR